LRPDLVVQKSSLSRQLSMCAQWVTCAQLVHLRAEPAPIAWRMADGGDTAGQT